MFDPPEKYPEDKTEEDFEAHAATANRGHQRDFLDAIKKRSKPIADIEQGYVSTASCILANISQKLGGKTIALDPKTGNVTDDDVKKHLVRPYRKGYKHPAG